MTRLRSQGYYGLQDVNYHWTGHGFPGGDPGEKSLPTGWQNFIYISYMEDALVTEHRYHDTFITRRMNPCLHRKWLYSGNQMVPFTGDHGSVVTPHEVGPSLDLTDLSYVIPFLSDALRESLHMEAFNAFTTQFPQQMSAAEFLGGMRELDQLLPKLKGDFIKDVAGLHLTNEFGWQSLLSDLKVLGEVVQKTQERLQWLRETYGKPTKLSFYRKDVLPYIGRPSYSFEHERTWGFRYELSAFQMDYRAGSTLTQFMTHLDDTIGLLRGLTGAFGLDNPIKAAWEILPFSFVVDYVFKISTHLDRLTRVKPAEPWTLSKVSHSFKAYADIDVIQVNDNQLGTSVLEETFLGRVRYNYYERGVGLPVSLATLTPENLSPDQLVLLLAIFAGSK